jgi:hypothetical protein
MIVIPMAGMSRRFTDAGYDVPKYMLPIGEKTVFAHAVGSFQAYFDTTTFLMIARDVAETERFIERECEMLGIGQVIIQVLDAPTTGQAETVLLGVDRAKIADQEPLTIFNIDTFRPGFRFPDAAWFATSDGYLEVFRGAGANWSYVQPADTNEPLARATAEKRPISDLCCTGLYHFTRAGDFRWGVASERSTPSQPEIAELYVAPVYNHLIGKGARIHYDVISPESVIFCGVPTEYEALRRSP